MCSGGGACSGSCSIWVMCDVGDFLNFFLCRAGLLPTLIHTEHGGTKEESIVLRSHGGGILDASMGGRRDGPASSGDFEDTSEASRTMRKPPG